MKQLLRLGILLSGYAAYGQAAHRMQAQKPAGPQLAPSAQNVPANPQRLPSNDGIDQGWAFAVTPAPPFVDELGGYLRFKVSINAKGQITAVERVDGNMTAKQTQLCRKHIMKHFTVRKTRPDAAAATGFYTFRFRLE